MTALASAQREATHSKSTHKNQMKKIVKFHFPYSGAPDSGGYKTVQVETEPLGDDEYVIMPSIGFPLPPGFPLPQGFSLP